MGRLDGKVAIITGAGMGMGRAAAKLFAKEGARVVVADWNRGAGEEVVNIIKKAGSEAKFVEADVSNEQDIRNMIKTTVSTYGELHILYNNAGTGIVEPLIESTQASFDKMVSINLKGVWLAMKHAIPEMVKAKKGSIINTASVCATAAQRGLAIYSATKGGIISMSLVAAVEHAPQNIRVNCINPGPIRTKLAMKTLKDNPEAIRRIEMESPQGRFGEPEEVAQAALFLASDESSHITGHTLVVDGGMGIYSHIM
jgi:NAD(P)-dependent dehydrogenase (short-subunit alcohol dehydrogenase family)